MTTPACLRLETSTAVGHQLARPLPANLPTERRVLVAPSAASLNVNMRVQKTVATAARGTYETAGKVIA